MQQGISCSSLQHIHISRNHENIISASITFEVLSPLLTFTCLTQVIIINHGFDLDDENLQIMASAWTCLQALVLITLNPRHSQPRITINGLVSLVQHCPSLVDLTIAFDASQAYLRAEGGARNERSIPLVFHIHPSVTWTRLLLSCRICSQICASLMYANVGSKVDSWIT